MDKVTLTLVRNPFSPHENREILSFDFKNQKIIDLIDEYCQDKKFEYVSSINGQIVDENTNLSPGDHVVLCAKVSGGGGDGDKNIFRTVALIGVLVVATAFTGGAIAPFIGGGTFGGVLSGAIVSVGGSLLINSVLPPSTPDLPNDVNNLEASNTYGWSPSQNQIVEGLTLPVIYGKHKVTPYIISRHTSTDGDNQYLNVLYALADGQIDVVDNIRINNNPIANYPGVNASSRIGTNSQSVIPGFQDQISEKAVGLDLIYPNHTQTQTNGNAVQGLGVGIIFSKGFFVLDTNNGTFLEHEVTISVEFKKVSESIWTPFGDSPFVMTDNRNAPVRRFFRQEGLSPDQYDIRVLFENDPSQLVPSVSGNPSKFEIVADAKFDYIQEIIPDDFEYPNTALLSITALATEQLNGSHPLITCDVTRSSVQVWNGSSYVSMPATNPAWACYDMLHNDLYGGAIDKERILFSDFQAWATWCDNQSLTVNMVFDSSASLHEMLNRVSILGRGSVIQRGTDFGAIYDGVSSPVQLFTVGNIIADTFEEEYIEKANRANSIEVTYYDENNDFERRTVEVHADDFETTTEEIKRNSVNLVGCTNFDMAKRHAKFLLNSNKHLVRTVRFQCEVDAVAAQPGDVIAVQHDVPQWGHGGRIKSATLTTVTLDREVPVDPGETYQIIVRHHQTDTLETVTLQNPGAGNHDIFNLVGTWTTTPSEGDVYSIGIQNIEVKEFRVLKMQRSQDVLCKITALEYRPEVYDDSVAIPDFPNESDLPQVAGLLVDDIYRIGQDGIINGIIAASWRGFAIIWQVYYKEQNEGIWRKAGETTRSDFEITELDIGKTYTISVTTTDNPDDGEQSTVSLTIDPPEQVQNINAEVVDNFIVLKWTAPNSELPISNYVILKGQNFQSAQIIGNADKTFTTFFERASGSFRYWIYAVDMAGNKGQENFIDVTLSVLPDFEQSSVFDSNFDGLKTNLVNSPGVLNGPIDTNETWEQFFDNNGFNTFQDFIDAGHTFYFQPDIVSSGSYEEPSFDLGAFFASITVNLSIDYEVITGDPTSVVIIPTLFTSPDNVNFTDHGNVWQVNAENIQYVKYRLDAMTDGQTKIKINHASVGLILKHKRESGKSEVTDAVNGKVINFQFPFADVDSIVATAKSTGEKVAVYDFNDVPNPSNFTVFLFENGNKTTGEFSYEVVGV